jgi:hypothetical protein
MNTRRKFLRMVDLRVHHYYSTQRSGDSSRLGRLHPIESLRSGLSVSNALQSIDKSPDNLCYQD